MQHSIKCRSLGNNILDASKDQSVESIFTPNRLLSLFDLMKIILTREIVDLHWVSFKISSTLLNWGKPQDIVSAIHINGIKEGLDYFETHLLSLNLNFSIKYLAIIRKRLTKPLTYKCIEDEFEILNIRIEDEMKDIIFGFIPKEKAAYFEQEALFGNEIFEKFPSAREEIKEAGNCYAHGNYTATVFHLIRAVKIGAKAMVIALKADKHITTDVFTRGHKTKKKIPIELCDWQKLIGGLNKALNELEKGKATNI